MPFSFSCEAIGSVSVLSTERAPQLLRGVRKGFSFMVLGLLTACSDGSDSDTDTDTSADTSADTEVDTEPDTDAVVRPIAQCTGLVENGVWILVGSGSTGDGPLLYQWSLDELPQSSSAALETDTEATALVSIDVFGSYTANLVVTDIHGVESEPCALVEGLWPEAALHVELEWQLEADDLDLHLIRAGEPALGPGDCHHANCRIAGGLEWGDPDSLDDNPVLTGDIPNESYEFIEVEAPVDDTYFVMIHDYPNASTDLNQATVRVYLDEMVVFEGIVRISGSDSESYMVALDTALGTATPLPTTIDPETWLEDPDDDSDTDTDTDTDTSSAP